MRSCKRKIALLLSALLATAPTLQVSATALETEGKALSDENESETETLTEEVSTEDISEKAEMESEIETDTETEVPTKESEIEASADEMNTEEYVSDNETSEPEEVSDEEVSDEEILDEKISDEEVSQEAFSEEAPDEEIIPDIEKYLNYKDVDIEVGIPDKRGFSADDLCYTFEELPSYYDGYEQGRVSDVKVQSPFGSCWSFSAVAIAESAYMRLYNKAADEINLSESHLVEFFYNNDDAPLYTDTSDIADDIITPVGDVQEERGGNSLYTTPVLASWKGIADEALDNSLRYETAKENNEAEIDSKYAFTDAVHLENAYYIPITDRDGVKSAIMEFGGVSASYYYSSTYDSNYYTGEAYYCPVDKGGTNHAITIVGWDDNYSIDNFKQTKNYSTDQTLPKNNGAWLIKNSWGTEYHNDGFFWISYEDATLNATVYAYDFGKGDNYDYNYQYDGGAGSAWLSSSKQGAAIYKATGNQEISAVGVSLRKEDVNFKVEIYTNLKDMSNPESGELVHTQQATSSYQGFYTVELDKAIKIPKGETFSIVIKSTDNTSLYLGFDMDLTSSSWINMKAGYKEGQTFYKSGTSWYDGKNLGSTGGTVRIKAYADKSTALFENMLGDIEDQIYTGTEITPDITVTTSEGIVLTKDIDYALSYTDNIDIGTAKVIIAGKGKYTGSIEATFNIIPITITSDMIQTLDKTYDGESYNEFEIIYNGNVVDETNYDVVYERVIINEDTAEIITETLNETPVDAGKYNLVVTGKGNFTGKTTAQFTINPILFIEDMFTASDIVYNGNEYDKAELNISGLDSSEYQYSIRYYKNEIPKSEPLELPPTAAGKYIAEAEVKGNCEGVIAKEFTIHPGTITEDMVNVENTIYNGLPYDKVKVTNNGKEFLKGDYTISFYKNEMLNDSSLYNEPLKFIPIDAGDYFVVVEGNDNYIGTVKKDFTIAKASIEVTAQNVNYSNTAYDKLIVTANGKELTSECYDLVYYKNETPRGDALKSAPTQAGSYIAAVEGKGNYAGKIEADFDIEALSITEAEIKTIFDEEDYFIDAKVIFNEGELEENKDYKIEYYDYTGKVKLTEKPIYPGTYHIKADGIGNYKDNLTVKFNIPYKFFSAEMFEVENTVYNGTIYNAVKPKTIKDEDFEVSYNRTPINAGLYVAKVEGKNNYEGTIIYNFKIEKLTLIKDMIADIDDYEYTGLEIKPKAVVAVDGNEIPAENYTISYSNNKNAGTATVIIRGKGNCQGTVKKTFTILPKKTDDLTITVPDAVYTGGLIMPQAVVKDGKKTLKAGKDYTVSYNENIINADTKLTDKDNPTLTITGCGNYTGSKTISFAIEPMEVKAKMLKTALYCTADNEALLEINVKNKLLTKGTDYDVKIVNQTTQKTVTDLKKIQLNEKYSLTLTFKGNYTSKEPVTIKNIVCKMSIADFDIKFIEKGRQVSSPAPLTYNKKLQKPKIELVSGENILKSSNYTVSYINNVNAGTAMITVTGKGQYSGSKSAKFEILPKELGADIMISGLEDKIYTGREIKPAISIKGLKYGVGKDFWITEYKNNINANYGGNKSPEITIQLSDNYCINGKNTISKTFNIKPAKITSVKVSKAYYQNGRAVEPELIVKAGKLILSKDDYTVKWNNNLKVGNASVIVSADAKKGNFYILKPIEVKFKIIRESLSKAKAVQLKKVIYTGEALDFNDYYVLYDYFGNIIDKSEYEITPDNRITAGSVSVTFKAKSGSRFTGKKTIKCKVESAYIGDYLELTQTGLPVKYYNGGKAITFTKKELKAAFKDKVTGEAILPNSFTVKYENNTEAGEGKLYITGKKNYSGTVVLNFNIN